MSWQLSLRSLTLLLCNMFLSMNAILTVSTVISTIQCTKHLYITMILLISITGIAMINTGASSYCLDSSWFHFMVHLTLTYSNFRP